MNAPIDATGALRQRTDGAPHRGPAARRRGSRYADDVTQPGQTHLVFLAPPYAHARIAGVDTGQRRGRPRRDRGPHRRRPESALASGRCPLSPFPASRRQPVRHRRAPRARHRRGCATVEAVAAVVATSQQAAAQGAEAIQVDYDEALRRSTRCRRWRLARCAVPPPRRDNIARGARRRSRAAAADAFGARRIVVRADRQPARHRR